jgi:hypothetical protein
VGFVAPFKKYIKNIEKSLKAYFATKNCAKIPKTQTSKLAL